MSRFAWGCAVYGPWFLLWLVLELTALWWKGCPWPTLSRTVWTAEDKWSWTQLVFFAGLAILTVHIIWGFPNRVRP